MTATFAQWRSLGTATVSDALDRFGLAYQCHGIVPMTGRTAIAGRAFTVLNVAARSRRGSVGDYIDDVAFGDVVVIDNGGRLDASVWGDLLTTTALVRGVAGTVIDGVCRDLARSRELGYPLFSRGSFMRTGKDRVEAQAVGVPVAIGHVRVELGDLVIGDQDGVVIVSANREEAVFAAAMEISQAEQRIRDDLLAGIPLARARREHHYFELQRRRP